MLIAKDLTEKGHLWLLHKGKDNEDRMGMVVSAPGSAHPSFLGFAVFALLLPTGVCSGALCSKNIP